MDQLLDVGEYRDLALGLLAPQASLSAWDWCSRYLHLRTGRWDAQRAGLMRHWYEISTARITGTPRPGDPWAHRTEELYLVMIAQLAKTTVMQSLVAWVLAQHAREVAWYDARGKNLKRFHRRGLVPMIEQTAPLERLLPVSLDAREQALGAEMISLGGSLLYLLNANLVEDARSLALPLIVLDEFDQLAEDLEGQGDPVDLIKVRQRTMPHDRLLIGGTTPGAVNGHGWRRLRTGSHERPLVLCPVCQGADYLNDLQVVSGGEHDLSEYPAQAIVSEHLGRWACRWCGELHGAATVRAMVLDAVAAGGRWCPGTWEQSDAHPSGHWTPAAEIDGTGQLQRIHPAETVIRSGWANALYSEHVTLDSFAAGLATKLRRGKPTEQKTWTNTEACRPWIHVFTPISTDDIADRSCATYAHGSCPVAADWLIMTLDQQGNQAGRFWWAYVLRAWVGRESWLVAAGKAMGETALEEVMDTLYPIGREHRAADLVVMDIANPNYRERGYRWAADDPRRRLVVRGDVRLAPGETWRVVDGGDARKTAKTNRPSDVHEWRIHPHHWRSELEARITGSAGIPWHLPSRETLPDFYLRSLNAEDQTVETRRVVGGAYEEVVVWRQRVTSQTDDSTTVRKDEHWADGEKMQLAIVDILGLAKDAPPAEGAPSPAKDEVDEAQHEPDTYATGVW